MKITTTQMLDELCTQAAAAPRRRKNLNIHYSEQSPCNRLYNAGEPDTYIPPHCHADPVKDETMIIIRGKMGVVFFDAQGNITETTLLAAGGENLAVTIPAGMFHTSVMLEPGSMIFEAKAGPYAPLLSHEKVAWAPAEGAPEAPAFLAKLKKLFM
ncbi:MAG: cupin fold metalloprotein, WbuC family [Verrucomicrobia bacterium]|nr:MAG: cupin fold metalloprotein, WbuC family [Verrucomicrobiota bacterium]